jgi:hypothetical protein
MPLSSLLGHYSDRLLCWRLLGQMPKMQCHPRMPSGEFGKKNKIPLQSTEWVVFPGMEAYKSSSGGIKSTEV